MASTDATTSRDIGNDHMAGISFSSVWFWLNDALKSDQPVAFHWNARGHLEMRIGGRRRAAFDRSGGSVIYCDTTP